VLPTVDARLRLAQVRPAMRTQMRGSNRVSVAESSHTAFGGLSTSKLARSDQRQVEAGIASSERRVTWDRARRSVGKPAPLLST
jgi:hypothetical protein